MAVHPNSLSNLKPQKPGEPGHNQTGSNQWTHRRDAILHMEERAKRDSKPLHDLLWDDALAGNYQAIKLLWEDLHPRTERHEIDAHHSGSVEGFSESQWAEFAGRFDRIQSGLEEATPQRGNGSGKPSNGSGDSR